MDKGSSLLLGIDGLVVDRVLVDASGRRVVHCSTDPELAGWCPDCRQQSSSPKERVTTRPRDVRIGPDRPELLWHKRKWHCRVPECERRVFTEALPEEIPPRARITTRARAARSRSVTIYGRCPRSPTNWAWTGGSRTTRSSPTVRPPGKSANSSSATPPNDVHLQSPAPQRNPGVPAISISISRTG